MAVGAVAMVPLALANSVIVLVPLLVVAGLPSTAQWATSSLALDSVAPRGGGAEAYTWLSTANAVGFAVGGVLGGIVIELSGTSAAFLAGAALVAPAALALVARGRTLSEVAA